MKRLFLILALLFVTPWVTFAQKPEPKLEGYLAPDGSFISLEMAGGAPETLIAKYLQMFASAPTCSRKGQLYYDTVLNKQRVCTATPSTWETVLSGSSAAAPVDATYITETANSTLTNEFALGSLGTGILKNTTTTGVPSIALAGTDYQAPITFGTGVLTALGVNIGSAGAPVLFNGAGGTPSSLTGTNITGTAASLTAGTASAVAVGGITGLGTGVGTFLATPSGANLASALTTALPATKGGTGLTSLGTNVATALGNTTNGAGGFVTADGTATLTNKTLGATSITGNLALDNSVRIGWKDAGGTPWASILTLFSDNNVYFDNPITAGDVIVRGNGGSENARFGAAGVSFPKTITAGGTAGAQTINKTSGSVNFAATATSLVVTNSLVTSSSVIICTVGTNDTTMKSAQCVAGTGSFTIFASAAATAETRVNFLVTN